MDTTPLLPTVLYAWYISTLREHLRCGAKRNATATIQTSFGSAPAQTPHITQIAEGKTNQGQKLYGCCVRSKDITECWYEAYALYMA
jgi:hypothetical protein